MTRSVFSSKFFPAFRWFVIAALFARPLLAADVKSFGAAGDGKADDTAAIQKAIDSGGSVHFPAGTYRITRSIGIELERTGLVALSGDGTARVIMAGPGARLPSSARTAARRRHRSSSPTSGSASARRR